MAKHGYTCKCGWSLKRLLSRREYAFQKEKHAVVCGDLKEELKQSGKGA